MLDCQHIVKDYVTGDEVVHALKGVSFSFRDQEFVAILGQSGCGKTTLLNIIGGLDQYTSGDLVINGRSTKRYSDQDWDTYRNHRVGFVFQSYNLIMHQSVLSNVELALTLTGVEKEERRKRAKDVLKRLGLEDQMYKKPTQLSGGQMQRVAIARALINNPDIVLADEPTGALDSETSIQIMDLLKEISEEKLVIMVTHNPELADQYATRIIRLLDGEVLSDTNPATEKDMEDHEGQLKRPSMSLGTALSLSMNNLMTKKARTFLTSFAGSIGIIGIALILSLSNGMQTYIDTVENDTMASYPIEIQANALDMTVMMTTMMDMQEKHESHEDDKIYTYPMVADILDSVSSSKKNNLTSFKKYVESDKGKKFRDYTKAIEYSYDLKLQVFNEDTDSGLVQVSPNGMLDRLGLSDMLNATGQFSMTSMNDGQDVWCMLPESKKLRDDEFELVAGHWPKDESEVVLAVDENNEISDYALLSLGLLDQDSLVKSYQKFVSGNTDELEEIPTKTYTMDELMDVKFRLVLNSDMYENVNGVWINRSDDKEAMKKIVSNSKEVKVVGIIRPGESTAQRRFFGAVYYTKDMQDYVIEHVENSEIVKQQRENPNINVFTGKEFTEGESFDVSSLSVEEQMQLASMSQEELMSYMATYNENINATYDSVMTKLGVVDYDKPTAVMMYVSSFEDKEKLTDLISDYNTMKKDQGKESDVLTYNDLIGTMLKSITNVINLISYVLIGFVSVSLVVSSIMIGIITYISVLERIKEIGILRAIGASKKDISRVFNAETFIIGLTAGLMGILITILLILPANAIVYHLAGVSHLAKLPWQGAIILILLSLVLTIIAGLIPARIAARKDPVEALRSE
ncbi:MAG: ABC transporter ATP-binding protein/permease [Erysipelotrichaceae bacterium]|nr:ABC transporter ATP-binding protein/permease [Erysipelotrichaceae bacterium]